MGLAAAAALLAAGLVALVAVRRGKRSRAASREGKLALRLVAGGLALAVLCILLNAGLDVSIGRLHPVAALAFLGLLAVVAGGVFAMIAITQRGERSTWVFATVPVWLFALLWVVLEVAFDVP